MFTHFILGDTFLKPYYLYKIVNKINGKLYIGVTKNPEERKKSHYFNRSQTSRSLIKNAIDKYGVDNFEFIIICIGDRGYIFDLEAKSVQSYQTLAPYGYNIQPGGEGGQGHKINKRSDDYPVYVTGFWFPNVRTVLAHTTISKRSLYYRLKKGNAGDLVWSSKTKIQRGDPVYVYGLWFPCIYIASSALKKPAPSLRKRIRSGSLEEKQKPNALPGEGHYLYGKTGDMCVNSKPVMVEGIRYVSVKEAVDNTNYSEDTLRKLLKSENQNFIYLQET